MNARNDDDDEEELDLVNSFGDDDDGAPPDGDAVNNMPYVDRMSVDAQGSGQAVVGRLKRTPNRNAKQLALDRLHQQRK